MSSQKTIQKAVSGAKPSKGGKRLMIDVSDFKVTNWSNTEIDFEDEKNKNGNQFTCYGRYNYGKESSPVQNQLVFKTGPVKLVTYGIPQLGQYAKTDKDRSYIKLPYDTTQQSCVSLFKMFEALDSWAIKNKDKFFTGKLSKFAKIYDYTPIVRKPQEAIPLDDDEQADAKPKSEKLMYAKLKISTDWQSGDVNTTVFAREDGVPVKQEVKTVTEMANLVTWQSTIQMICAANKLWFGKSADKQGRRQYGISFKLLQCEVVERTGSASAKADFTSYAFDDSVKVEEKDEIESVESKKNSPKKVVAPAQDSDDESEDEQPVVKAAAKKVEEDSDSDDSEDDSEDDSDEDEKPVAKGKKPVAKQTKKVADSDDDESEEEEKPAPKVQATKKTAKSSR
jgi:hypothetical protein